MRIPKYWARESKQVVTPKGKSFSVGCWRWSDLSFEDARLSAIECVRQIAHKASNNQSLDRYSYGERPLREEILDTITNQQNEVEAILTRNAYGAIVLNAARAMFVDIDFEEESMITRLGRRVRKLFGQSPPDQESTHLQNIEKWVQFHPGWGMRVYRTFGGLRCLVTHQVFDPTRESTEEILKGLGCDPLYIRLCRRQESFRARLTPKPWRSGLRLPPSRYPWNNKTDEEKYRHWEEKYRRASAKYTVCKLVKKIGWERVHPEVEPIMKLHDDIACHNSVMKLA